MQAKETIDEIRTYTVDAKVDNLAKLPTEMQAGLKVCRRPRAYGEVGRAGHCPTLRFSERGPTNFSRQTHRVLTLRV